MKASTGRDMASQFDPAISLAGEENVGIGTDFTEGHGVGFSECLRSK